MHTAKRSNKTSADFVKAKGRESELDDVVLLPSMECFVCLIVTYVFALELNPLLFLFDGGMKSGIGRHTQYVDRSELRSRCFPSA
jgi:hypothetical protein